MTRPSHPVGRALEIGVVADDGRVLATELHDHWGQVLRGGGEDLFAGRGRPGERDDVDVRLDDRRADRAVTDDDLEHPVGETGGPRHLADEQPDPRRVLGRLVDDRVAGGERGNDVQHRQVEGVVPRGDDRGDPERPVVRVRFLAEQWSDPRGTTRLELDGQLGVVTTEIRDGDDHAAGLGEDLAGLDVIGPRDVRRALDHLIAAPAGTRPLGGGSAPHFFWAARARATAARVSSGLASDVPGAPGAG